jgi:hypothetical protein
LGVTLPNNLPDGINRDHILQAIQDLDDGLEHRFADSTVYDVLFEDKRYPPKAVIGLAAQHLTGSSFGPSDFSGGEQSKCFRILRSEGFEIVRKLTRAELIEEIESYPSSTIFSLDPSVDLDGMREGDQTGWLNRDRIAWLGLDGKTLQEIRSTDNPYKQHPENPEPESHLAYDLELGRIFTNKVEMERQRRMSIWSEVSDGSSASGLLASDLRSKGIYGGAAGIWCDKTRTRDISGDVDGVTMSVLHNGFSYADDLSDDCLLYHYPETGRSGRTDAGEIQATKNAHRLSIPVFVITHPYFKAKTRDLKLGWIQDWDDECKQFLISFGETPPVERQSVDEKPFVLTVKRKKKKVAANQTQRSGQQEFKFRCLQRYGTKCAVCDATTLEMLDAAHLKSVQHNGSDDPRNGLILCANHHRALDAKLFAIDPHNLSVCLCDEYQGLEDLQIQASSISQLKNRPHEDALRWVWKQFKDSYKENDPQTAPIRP